MARAALQFLASVQKLVDIFFNSNRESELS